MTSLKKMTSLVVKSSFPSAKCKTLLRYGIARKKSLNNKKLAQIASGEREVAELLRNGQESNARLRVEHIIREQNLIDGYELLSVYAEQLLQKIPVIESQKTCPPELKEGISTLLFASSRCTELTDFAQLRPMFVAKYGKEFVSAAEELRPGCGVNGTVIEKLSVTRPSGAAKLQVMKDIAAKHNVEWDPAPFENEMRAVPHDLLDGTTNLRISAETIYDFPSVPTQKPTLGTHLAQPDNFANSNSGSFMEDKAEPTNSPRPGDDYRTVSQGARSGPPTRFMEDKAEPTNSPRPGDDYRAVSQGARSGPPTRFMEDKVEPTNSPRPVSQGARSGPPTRKPPGLGQSRTEELSFDNRHTDMDPGRRETQPRRNSRRESDSFALSLQARHQDEETRRNSIGVPREKSGRARTESAFGGIDESLPHDDTKHNRRESQVDFDGSHRSDRRQSQKYDQYEGKGQVREANAEPSSYTKNSLQARTSQEELNRTSDEDEQGVFAKTRPGTDAGRRNQTRKDQDLDEVNYSTVSRKEGSGKSKPRRQDQSLEEDYYKRVPSREGSGKARAQYQDQEPERAPSREGSGKGRTYHEDQHSEEQNFRRASSKEGSGSEIYSRDTLLEEGSHGRISGRGKEGKQYGGKYRRHDESDEDADHIPHRSEEPSRRDSTKNTPKYIDEDVHNPEWDSEYLKNSVTTRIARNSEDEHRDSAKGTRRDSLAARKKDNEKSISDTPHFDSSEHEDDARRPESRSNTRNSDRSSESGEEGSRQSTRRTPRLPSVDEQRRDTLDDVGSSRGKRYGREDPDSLKTPRDPMFDNDHVDFDDDKFSTSSRTEKRMSLPGGSVRNKSKYQGNRASDDYDDTVRSSGRRATIGPEEIHSARVRETEDPSRSRYGEREKQSDRRQSAPLPKNDIMEGRQSPTYSSQRDRSDRHRKGDIPAGFDDDRPPRFSNPKVGLQASLDDEYSANTRAQRDRSDRLRKSDISPRYDNDNPPPRFIKVGKDEEGSSSGQRFVNSPRRSDEPLQATPRPPRTSNLQSVKTEPDLSATPKTPAPEHRKSQSASDSQPQSRPVYMKPPDLDDLLQMFGKKK